MTERKQLTRSKQPLLAGILNSVGDGIITIDEWGVVKTLNTAAERLFGYIASYLPTGEGKVIGGIHRVLPARRKDGSMFQIELAVTEFSLTSCRHFVGIVRDLTDRNRITELATADRMKDEFLATLAHELRNALAPIRNTTQALCMVGPTDPPLQEMRDAIERQVAHMVRLVDDLLDVSRISRGAKYGCTPNGRAATWR